MDNLQTSQENKPSAVKQNVFSKVLLPLLSLVSFYIVLSGTVTGQNSFYTFVVSLIFPAAYSAVLVSARSNISRALPIGAAAAVFAAALLSGAVTAGSDRLVTETVISAAGLVGISAVMFFCFIKKYNKTAMLIGVSAVFVVMSVVSLCAATVFENGYLTAALVIEQINTVFRAIRDGVMSIYETALDNETLLDTFRTALSAVMAQEEITKETLLPVLEEGVDAILSIIRSCLPALLALYSMALSFVIIAFFTVFAKSSCVLLSNESTAWEYTVSGVSARVFNASLLVAILGSIIRLPSIVIVTCINLTIMLTPLLCIIAVKEIYRALRKKGLHGFVCVVIMLAVFMMVFGIVQIYAFELLAFTGVYITVYKERINHININNGKNK